MPSQFYELKIENKKVGWLFGWDRSNGIYGTDLTFARIIAPVEGKFDSHRGSQLFSESYDGLKFKQIADLLAKNSSELLIIYTDHESNVFNCGACYGRYHSPYQVTIKNINGKISVIESNVKVNQDLIESNSYYAYSIAFGLNDHKAMKEASSQFLHDLKIASEKCGRFDIPLNKWNDNIYTERGSKLLKLYDHWEKAGELLVTDRYNIDILDDASECLENEVSPEFDWYVFMRTGLFPSEKTINSYIENELLIDTSDFR
jgi:hypothetical protein